MNLSEGMLVVDWEEWPERTRPFDGYGLTVAFDRGDRQPRPTVRLSPEETRALRDYLNELALD